MELSVAKSLIENGIDRKSENQVWADLGAGDGLFTRALIDLLPHAKMIIAVDQDERALRNISASNGNVQKLVADLNDLPTLPLLDGIVMANALHYIKDQKQFLSNLKSNLLKKSGVLILVEYNLEKSNPWVPYPLSKNRLQALAEESGFVMEIFSKSVKSKLNSSEIYSALLKPKV